MKKILSIILITCTVALFSCKKSTTTSFALVGLWSGTHTVNNDGNNYEFAVNFKSENAVNGIMGLSIIGDALFPGNTEIINFGGYTNVNGLISFTIRFNYPNNNTIYNYSCNYSSNSSTMSGTYGLGTNPNTGLPIYTGAGTFTITRR